jgi:exonuclease I
VVGYNNIRFDDEVTRNIFYRNFYDPYAWSWQNRNSRWDLLDIMRACYALRPEGIHWPENEEGLTSFRLEHLTRANGIEHSNAHDAMADVYATIAMAKLVKSAQPRLFEYLLSHRSKQKLMTLIDVPQMKPLVHISGMFGAWRGNTSWVAPLAWHPDNRNAVIMVDLAGDISPLLELDSDTLRERLYTPKNELGDLPRCRSNWCISINVRYWRRRIRCARKMLTGWALTASTASITSKCCVKIRRCARKWWPFLPKPSRSCRLKTWMPNSITVSSAMPTARP